MTDAPATPAAPAPAPVKKSRMGKLIWRTLGALILLLIVAVVVLFLSLNTLVRKGVVRGGKYATGQNTGLALADLSVFGGALQLNGLDIDNFPKERGYSEPKILTMRDCQVKVDTSTIFTNTIVVQDISISGLEITLEQHGPNNNLSELIDQIQKNTSAAAGAPTPASGGQPQAGNTPPGRQLKIGTLNIAGTKVHIRSGAPLNINLDLDLPPLKIEEPTNPDGRQMKIADLVGKILLQISKQIVENPQVPSEIKDRMKNVQAVVDNLKGALDKDVRSFEKSAKKGDVKQMEEAGKDIQKSLQDAGKNLGNMFNQPKKDPPK